MRPLGQLKEMAVPKTYTPSKLEDWIGDASIPLAAKVHRYVRRPNRKAYVWPKAKPTLPLKSNNRRDKEWWVNGVKVKLGEVPLSCRAKLLTFSRRSNRYLTSDDRRRLNLEGFDAILAAEHPDAWPRPKLGPERYHLPAIWSIGALEADVWRL